MMLRDATFSKTSLSVFTPKYLWCAALFTKMCSTHLGRLHPLLHYLVKSLYEWMMFDTCTKLSLGCCVDESDSDADVPRGKVLAAALQLVPGYFSCDCIWQTHFVLHPRLKSTASSSAPRPSISPGLLDNFCCYWSVVICEQFSFH